MKKKIYKFVSVTVIAVAMVVSFQMSSAERINNNLLIENLNAIALAFGESGSGNNDCWTSIAYDSDATNEDVVKKCGGGENCNISWHHFAKTSWAKECNK